MNRSESIANLTKALVQVQAKLKPASKDSLNPHFRSKYADLTSVWEAVREPLAENQLAVVQLTETHNGLPTVTTVLSHSSGEWISSELSLNPTKNDPQGVGSALTYARRYSLAAIVGVVADDDDGNAASTPPPPPAKKPEAKNQRMYVTNPPTESVKNYLGLLVNKYNLNAEAKAAFWNAAIGTPVDELDMLVKGFGEVSQ